MRRAERARAAEQTAENDYARARGRAYVCGEGTGRTYDALVFV